MNNKDKLTAPSNKCRDKFYAKADLWVKKNLWKYDLCIGGAFLVFYSIRYFD